MGTKRIALVTAAVCSLVACSSAESPESVDANTTVATDARSIDVPDGAPQLRPDAAPSTPDAGPDCSDDYEPNDSQTGAFALPAINDKDSNGSSLTAAVITGDDDWYTYAGSDAAFSQVDPSVAITGNVQVCMLIACNTGETEVSCPAGTTEAGGGQAGCCGTSDFTVDLNCVGPVSDDAEVHMQATATVTASCENYTLGYHY